jgi:hypothetical protein
MQQKIFWFTRYEVRGFGEDYITRSFMTCILDQIFG